MPENRLDEAELVAWWCANYERHRAEADRHHWRPALDAATADFAAGLPVEQIIARHHLSVPDRSQVERGALLDLSGLGIEGIPAAGDYGCPRARPCGRAADADPDTGREPRCAVADRTMRYRSRPGTG